MEPKTTLPFTLIPLQTSTNKYVTVLVKMTYLMLKYMPLLLIYILLVGLTMIMILKVNHVEYLVCET